MFCTMFGFDRKEILKLIHLLIQAKYGTYTELINMTLQELSDVLKVIKSIEQEETISGVGL